MIAKIPKRSAISRYGIGVYKSIINSALQNQSIMATRKRPPSISLYMKPEQRRFLVEQAKARGISGAALIRVALAHYCGAYPCGDQASK